MKKKTKKKVEPFKPWVRRVHKMLREKFFVKEYEYDIYWMNEPETKDGFTVTASIDINVRYLKYDLKIYPIILKKFKEGDYGEVVSTMVHEMSHLYTEPLYEFAINAATNHTKEILETIKEQQTQRISSCIYELIAEKLWKPKIK